VGKTSIIARYLGTKDISLISKTRGVSIENAKYEDVELIIWDFSGQKHYRDVILPFLKGSHIVVLVFDLSRRETLVNLINEWAKYVEDSLGNNVPVIIVGNKKDLKVLRDEFINSALEVMKKHLNVVEYMETSALHGDGIESLFNKLFQIAHEACAMLKNSN